MEVKGALRISGVGLGLNVLLALVKIVVGVVGNAYVLVADGIESTSDVISSLVVWSGIRISARPPDSTHPYGHGKADSIAAVLVALMLAGAGVIIAIQSVREIRTPHHAPEPYTLLVLVLVIVLKEGMYRWVRRAAREFDSAALRGDAWHHRSDAITSTAALVGISVALVGGEGYEIADDYAALAACVVILVNASRLLIPALHEVMDGAVAAPTKAAIRGLAADVDGVVAVEKCRIRKSGVGLLMDIHIEVDAEMTVRRGHEIAHAVQDRITRADHSVVDVVVHVEPAPSSNGNPEQT